MLIDSGATMSLLAKSTFCKLPENSRPTLEESSFQIKFANGDIQDSFGQTRIPITIGDFTADIDFLVGDFTDEAIIGIKDLQKIGFEINFQNMTVIKDDKDIPVHDSFNRHLSSRVFVKHITCLPPRQTSIVWGQVKTHEVGDDQSLVMLQSVRSIVHKHGVLPAKSLHKQNQNCIPVSIYNSTEATVVLQPDETVGILVPIKNAESEVSEICYTQQANKCEASEKDQKLSELPQHMTSLFERSIQYLSKAEQEQLKTFMIRYADQFSKDDFDIGFCDVIEHEIITKDVPPVKQNPRRLGPEQRIAADKIVEELLERGLVKPSKSAWASPIVMVKKKDNTYRMCIDYREVNKHSTLDAYPLPTVNQCISQLSQARWFCSTDLACGYWQVKVDENSKNKTAFCTRRGLFEWEVMPFGLSSACATFQRLMETILCEMRFDELLIYLDDILIWGRNVEETLERLGKFLDKLKSANLKLKPNKCSLFQKEVQFLGHIVSDKGISCDPTKIEAIKSWKVPSNVKELKSFLGLCNYYKKFIDNYSTLAKPLTELTSLKVEFSWNEGCQRAFEQLKQSLISAPILGYPKNDGLFILDTDASDVGIGAVLSQVQNDQEVVITYGSRTLSPQEKNYCVTQKELLAIIHHIKIFKDYLLGKHFKVRTDHWSLKYLQHFREPEGQLARWLDFLQPFDFEIIVRPGKNHGNADALSRKGITCGGKKCHCCKFSDLEYEPPVKLETRLQNETGTQTDDYPFDLEISSRSAQIIKTIDSGNFSSIDCKEIISAQTEDTDIGPIYNLVRHQKTRPKWCDISSLSAEAKRLICE